MKAVLATLVLFSATAVAAAPTLAGEWSLNGSVSGVDYNETCKLNVDAANKITGSCILDSNSYDVTGTVDGKKVTFTHHGQYNGDDIKLDYAGTLADDGTLSGTVDVSPMQVSGTFTAKKNTATSAPPAPATTPAPSTNPK